MDSFLVEECGAGLLNELIQGVMRFLSSQESMDLTP